MSSNHMSIWFYEFKWKKDRFPQQIPQIKKHPHLGYHETPCIVAPCRISARSRATMRSKLFVSGNVAMEIRHWIFALECWNVKGHLGVP